MSIQKTKAASFCKKQRLCWHSDYFDWPRSPTSLHSFCFSLFQWLLTIFGLEAVPFTVHSLVSRLEAAVTKSLRMSHRCAEGKEDACSDERAIELCRRAGHCLIPQSRCSDDWRIRTTKRDGCAWQHMLLGALKTCVTSV